MIKRRVRHIYEAFTNHGAGLFFFQGRCVVWLRPRHAHPLFSLFGMKRQVTFEVVANAGALKSCFHHALALDTANNSFGCS